MRTSALTILAVLSFQSFAMSSTKAVHADAQNQLAWTSVADEIATEVDTYLQSSELSAQRDTDSCLDNLKGHNRFADGLGFFINELSVKRKMSLSVASAFKMPSDTSKYQEVSLISHPLCEVTKESLSKTIKKLPTDDTIALANRFANDHNRLRKTNPTELKKLWGKFFGCLAYKESLSTADLRSSQNVAKKYAPSDYQKPAGVKFYYDKLQPKESRLNIGMYQFTPNRYGNISPCIKDWNRSYSSCKITDKSQNGLIRTLGSVSQDFNAYCGVHKLLQTFNVQLHTTKAKNTHPSNENKAPANRCVTPHFYAGWAYNHFGPLQNSMGDNLGKLMRCVYQH